MDLSIPAAFGSTPCIRSSSVGNSR